MHTGLRCKILKNWNMLVYCALAQGNMTTSNVWSQCPWSCLHLGGRDTKSEDGWFLNWNTVFLRENRLFYSLFLFWGLGHLWAQCPFHIFQGQHNNINQSSISAIGLLLKKNYQANVSHTQLYLKITFPFYGCCWSDTESLLVLKVQQG